MAKIKYKGKLKVLRKYARQFGNMLCVSRKWLVVYLSPKEMRIFEKKFQWWKEYSRCRCHCGNEHYTLHKFKRYAYWWDLEKLLQGD